MSTNQVCSNDATSVARVDMKLEVVVIPARMSTARRSSTRLGWRLDADFASGDDFPV
jgi:hypothetical protein